MNTTKGTAMSDTPRTDAVRYFNEVGDEVVPPSFARQLERENAELVEALRDVTTILDATFGITKGYPPNADGPGPRARALLAKLGEA